MSTTHRLPRLNVTQFTWIVALVALIVPALPALADSPPTWYSTGTFASAPGEIVDMEFYGGDLYAVGDFPSLEPDGECRIARFDGVDWAAVTGLPDERWTRIVSLGANLYLDGGDIHSWNGSTSYVLKYSSDLVGVWQDQLVLLSHADDEILLFDGGAGWTGIGLGFGYGATIMKVFFGGTDLFVEVRTGDWNPCWGGYYTYTVYRQDNGSWVQTYQSGYGSVTGTADWQGAAWFVTAGGYGYSSGVRRMVRWDGASWVDVINSETGLDPAGVPTEGGTTNLFEYGDQLLVEVNGTLVQYDGALFQHFSTPEDGSVADVVLDGSDGWFGGDFRAMDALVANGFALYTGGSWTAPSIGGTGLESSVIAIGEYDDQVLMATRPTSTWGANSIFTTNLDPADVIADVVHSEKCSAENLGTCQTFWGFVCRPKDSEVRRLMEFGGDLFALGGIADIDGLEAQGLAKWDGSVWSAVDHDQQDPSENLVVPEQLFALRDIGGVLWMAGYDDTPVVQQFDGSRFNDDATLRAALDALGPGCDYYRRYATTMYSEGPYILYGGPTVFDLVEYGGEVVLGTDEGLVSWDGVTLDDLDTGWMDAAPAECCVWWDGSDIICPKVNALAVDGDVLYAGGWFGLESDAIRNIVRYEGGQWLPLGDGLNGVVKALVARNGYLIAGGHFTHAGAVEVNGIALWDGAQWSDIDGGVADAFGGMTNPANPGYAADYSAYVEDLWLSDCGDLYVGGEFAEAGGVATSNLAFWSAPSLLLGPDCLSTSTPPAPRNLRVAARPNPFNPATEISFDLPRDTEIELAVFDLAGRRVRTLESGTWTAGSHVSTWRGIDGGGRRVASGVYVVRLRAGSESESIRVVMVK